MYTILLVEDDDSLRELLHCMLSVDYTVVVASDGREALAMFRTHSGDIDLLLVDAGLPYLGGWELAAMFDGVRPGMKCLVMSGNLDSQSAALNQPSRWWFIPKPFSPSELRTTVREILAASGHGCEMQVNAPNATPFIKDSLRHKSPDTVAAPSPFKTIAGR